MRAITLQMPSSNSGTGSSSTTTTMEAGKRVVTVSSKVVPFGTHILRSLHFSKRLELSGFSAHDTNDVTPPNTRPVKWDGSAAKSKGDPEDSCGSTGFHKGSRRENVTILRNNQKARVSSLHFSVPRRHHDQRWNPNQKLRQNPLLSVDWNGHLYNTTLWRKVFPQRWRLQSPDTVDIINTTEIRSWQW